MGESIKKIVLMVGVVAAIVAFCFLRNMKSLDDFHEKYEDIDLDAEGGQREGTYKEYQNAHKGAGIPQNLVSVNLSELSGNEDTEIYKDYEGADLAVYLGEESYAEWKVEVPESGLYNLYLEYMPVESRGVAMERAVYINGQLPFDDAANITFSRLWTDDGPPKVDNQGNEIRPAQVEVFLWQEAYCRDDMGYVTEPYQFYFEKGENSIALESRNEPMVIRKLELRPVQQLPSYEEYLQAQAGEPAKGIGLSFQNVIQGEDSILRSDSSLYAKYDRSSPTTYPNSVTKTLLNYVGGDAWSMAGQWIEWHFEVPEDGFYHITVKGRQSYSRGNVSSRTVYIDGEIPFEEMKAISFDYNNDWNCKTLSDAEGNPYQFYLEKGTHSIRLEATLGDLGKILEAMEDSTFRLNQFYRKLLVYIGASPDKYRDYNLDTVYPEIIEAMDLEAKRLYKIVDDMVAYSGQKADKIATAQTLAQQLERFVERPDKISVEFTTFKDNITALGTASLSLSESKLDVDYLVVSGAEKDPPKDEASIFAKIWHEIKSFSASFVVDYDAVGDVYEDDKDEGVVKVWVLTGRDQGTILKTMVDDTFTPDTGIKVNVEIVGADALLSAVVAGRGPNVVLSVGADQPVNYALRNAVEDLTQFADYKEALIPYSDSAHCQYWVEDRLYALPETQTFNVMFYRKDVLEELGLGIPQTWKELIEMFPTIQGNNLSVGIPSAAASTGNVVDISMYYTILSQYGGELYNEAGTATRVDEEAGVEAFADYTSYFNDYGIPKSYDFVSRFRSGEMPIGIANYSTYNTLVVSAPEIRGLWDFTLIPGTEKTDENGNTYIDRSDFTSGNATMMIKTESDMTRQNAWEFMKWWAEADTQVRFGREIEALLGSSARYATANRDAFVQLAWSNRDIEVLNEQWDQTVGVREVPGGYYTGRHLTNAIRKVINEKTDPRETILDYAIVIDEEIRKKRLEFGMSVDGE